ncbi:hypothetical protein [Collinsella aerofaciens]|uniref:hypothetical protein n=3 Tax=Collinsella TaxID=102106 RepID=UPI001C8B4DDF|nr:hypothetical protein [Collinsella aerofaciens]
MSSEKRGTIGSFALLGMTVAAVFGIKNIINNNAAIGLAAAPSFFFATLLYFVPYTWWRAQTWCKSVPRSVAASPDVTPS